MFAVCPSSSVGLFDWANPCVRASWAAFVPAGLVLVFLSLYIPLPAFLRPLSLHFRPLLTLREAEALDTDEKTPPVPERPRAESASGDADRVPVWLTFVLTAVGLLETCAWFFVGMYPPFTDREDVNLADSLRAIVIAFTWLYAAFVPLVYPSATLARSLFTLYLIHFIGGALLLGGVLFDAHVSSAFSPYNYALVGYALNLGSVTFLLLVQLGRPLALPSSAVEKDEIGKRISPEDYTTLWGWMSLSWIVPLIRRGTYNVLNEDDVWALSVTMRTRPVFRKFAALQESSLTRRIWLANSLDIILDFAFTIPSVLLTFLGPYFLKRIIDAIDSGEPAAHERAYLFAALMLTAQIARAEVEIQHLWFGRRVLIRIRGELMAAIYDKALKRRDFSGIVTARDVGKKGGRERVDPKSGADIGKIVNLMSADANRIATVVQSLYCIYGASFEVIIACAFLYQLLGWSAFAGFFILLLGSPLNSLIARRSIHIQRGILAARDKRMSVLNELIGSIKFIKFFAWEERWIARTLEARAKEVSWLVKSRFNSVVLQALWTTMPILVSTLTFLTYVAGGGELTVGTAFTTIALFNMIRVPLNNIPSWIVQLLQTRIALQRIETFLAEEEVDEQVSTIKRECSGPRSRASPEEGLGLRNASFKWNAVEEKGKSKADDNINVKVKGNDTKASFDVEAALVETSEALDVAAVETDRQFELSDISVVFPEGKLSVITGPTASGKTALLLALLGEMTLIPGRGVILMCKDSSRVDEHGHTHTLSYAAQTPWLQHQSIRENILFGDVYDEERYAAVVDACALRPDLDVFEDGDETEIGARGVSLSGGQKARVSLARAVYSRSKYVLLDDPLSAVDSHTSRFLYEHLFLGPLMKNRAVILVTHHIELVLPGTHYLVRMLDGRIDLQGAVKELRERGVLESITLGSTLEGYEEKLKEEDEEASVVDKVAMVPGDADISTGIEGQGAEGATLAKDTKKPRKLIKSEEREVGSVKWSIYKTYLRASSYWIWAILILLITFIQLLDFAEKFWIKVWSGAYGDASTAPLTHIFTSSVAIEQQPLFPDATLPGQFTHIYQEFGTAGFAGYLPSAHEKTLFYVGIYALIGFSVVLVSIISVVMQYTSTLRASRVLFEQLLVTVVRATMRWHDITPAGRMLNRFSKDIETIDSTLANSLQAVSSSFASFFSSIIVVVGVFPSFLIPATVIGYFYYVLAIGYLNTGRDLRRMESTSRSPIFSGFSELLEGIVTVRAFSAEPRFMNSLYGKADLTLQMTYTFWMASRCLLLRFDCLGALAVFTTTLFALSVDASSSNGWAGWAALCITSAIAFTTNSYRACLNWTQLELDLNSVERVVEYLDLPQEPSAASGNSRLPAHWPSSTGPNSDNLLEVRDLEVHYAPELPAVLHSVSFSLKARERIGLLGRTGSGKSTLAMSILRFVDPTKGQILIDGIDITSIGVHDLRARLTFIPQDAALFSGSLRDNLDPFGEYGDELCIDALRRVHIIGEAEYMTQHPLRTPFNPAIREGTDAAGAEAFSARLSRSMAGSHPGSPSRLPSETTTVTDNDSSPGKGPTRITLDTEVSAGGLNFSAGQRQLIAMARALLRQSAVIVLDEATSSIDFATDARIQRTIREEFSNSLLLTIAHRLRTVIDYDRLIVLDSGCITEFDTPYNLLQRERGVFREMCLKSGNFAELEGIARAKAEQDAAKSN